MSMDSTPAAGPAPPIGPEPPVIQAMTVIYLAGGAFCLALIMLVAVFYDPPTEAMSRSAVLMGVFVFAMAGAGRVSMDVALKFLTDVVIKRMVP
ncbi:hypothetical protein [Phenylobacterium aquaticum]|uniref:hypothetical protein n=1 Tax=Phenylobacterium aquaticum TaxID=1763816 RepID=UPI001F5DD870|nr:hypothetical protein [Phenylobacterium aquaticum]MCI3134047.1 hypothetical protein [Phenylobacterium aquaticum]